MHCPHTALFVVARLWIMDFRGPTFQEGDNPAAFIGDRLFRHLNFNYVYAINSSLMVLPQWLCFDWSMGCIPLIQVRDRCLILGFCFVPFRIKNLKAEKLKTLQNDSNQKLKDWKTILKNFKFEKTSTENNRVKINCVVTDLQYKRKSLNLNLLLLIFFRHPDADQGTSSSSY